MSNGILNYRHRSSLTYKPAPPSYPAWTKKRPLRKGKHFIPGSKSHGAKCTCTGIRLSTDRYTTCFEKLNKLKPTT